MGNKARAWAVVTWGTVGGGLPKPPLPLEVIVGVLDEVNEVVTDDKADGDGLVVESGLQLGDSRLLFEFSTKLSLRSDSFPGSIGSNQGKIRKGNQ